MNITSSALNNQVNDIIGSHLTNLGRFVPAANLVAESAPDHVISNLQRIADISQTPPRTASFELFQEMCNCLDDLEAFLATMNQPLDFDFCETTIGQVMTQAADWRKLSGRKYRMTTNQVWDFIAPANPDHLEDMGDGRYEARWWMPVPVMDIEILKYTEGVYISGEPYEPRNLPGGLALRFSISVTGKDIR
jgi:hypothetical protein